MKQHYIDEKTGISYTLQGDYYLPDFVLPGKLNSYLSDVDEQAEDMFFRLVEQMVKREGITEKLKSEQPMEWVGKMNALREAATEIVNAEVIFA